MNTKKLKCICVIFAVTFLIANNDLLAQPQNHSIQKLIDEYIDIDAPGMAVAIYQNGEVTYQYARGMSHLERQEKLSIGHQLRIGSITKQFTALAILQLVERGKIKLDDPISRYIEVPENLSRLTDKISIKHLLHHVSGLGNQYDVTTVDFDSLDTSNYPQNIINPILQSSLKSSVGAKFSYSNMGYMLLGHIIEIVSEESYEHYLKNHFFVPLGMHDTGFEYQGLDTRKLCTGYSFEQDKYVPASYLDMKIAFAAGGLVSTISDLAKWNGALFSGQIISRSLLKYIREPYLLPDGQSTPYSMGLQLGEIDGHQTIKHDGIVNGFTSMMIYVEEKDLLICALSNSDRHRNIEIPVSQMVRITISEDRDSLTMSQMTMDYEPYLGKYEIEDRFSITLIERDGKMYGQADDNEKQVLHLGGDRFYTKNTDIILTFNRNKTGAIESVTITQNLEMTVPKIE